MADEDRSNKTEDPTSRKLEDAHSKGQVVQSTEVQNWAMIAASTLVVAVFAGKMMTRLATELRMFLESPDAIPTDAGHLKHLLGTVAMDVLMMLAAPIGLLMMAAVAANFVQHRPVMAWEKLRPKLEAINPLTGLKNKFSMRTTTDLVKTLAKLVVVGSAMVLVVWPDRNIMIQSMTIDIAQLLPVIERMAMRMMIAILIVQGIIAAADYLYQWWDHRHNLMMSIQDIRDEHKDSEGDPHVKARIRQVRAERAKRRMMAAVPGATVIVTNPTHFAVALKYEPDEGMNAPTVVAKGQDLIALKIREVATENRIPIIENPPLARMLYASAEIDQEIPVEHYKAVAEVISFVFRQRRPRAGGPRVRASAPNESRPGA